MLNDVRRLTGLKPDQVEKLRKAGMHSVDDVWRHAGKDRLTGIDTIAEHTGIDKEILVKALTDEALREVEAGEPPLHVQHRFQMVVVFGILPLVALGFLALRTFVLPQLGLGTPIVQQVVAKPGGGLPAFHVIEASDVEARLTPGQTGALTTPKDAIGRQTLRSIASGAPVRDSQLSKPSEPVRQLVSVPVRRGRLSSALKDGDRVTLLFYARGGDRPSPEPTPIADVPVTAIDRTSNPLPLVIALTPEQLATATPLLATSDVQVVQPKP